MGTDIPSYPFEKCSMDVSGPYNITKKGNKYIVSMVDWLTNWVEAFPVQRKDAQTIAEILMNEIFPRHGAPRVFVTDNSGEFGNTIMKEVTGYLSVKHVTTSRYHPQNNAKVEKFHRFLGDTLSKLSETMDLFLNQALAAARFSHNETTKFTPYYLVHSRDVVLPLNNLLIPKTKYTGGENHKKMIEQQYYLFSQVRRKIKSAQKKRNERVNEGRVKKTYEVGYPVYFRAQIRKGKLDPRW